MKYNLTSEIELTDERAETSYGIPVLVIGGKAFGKADLLPAPFCIAGYDASGNHTGSGDDKCQLAGVLVRAHAGSLHTPFPTATFNFIKSFYA
jgi:hypothetical protein